MKRILLLTYIVLSFTHHIHAQYFLGLRASQWGGVTNVGFNPAIADNRLKFDMTIIGMGATMSNNYLGISRKALFNPDLFSNDNSQKVNFKENLNGKPKNVYQSFQIQGPLSFMFTFGKKMERHKYAIALTYNVNSVTNIDNISQKLARIAFWGAGSVADSIDAFDYRQLQQRDLALQHMTWVDYGITYSQVILDKDKHMLKGGVTLKLLQGIWATNTFIEDVDYRFQNFDTISIYDSRAKINLSPKLPSSVEYFAQDSAQSISDNIPGYLKELMNFGDAKPTVGADISFVYEYRPKKDNYQYEMDNQRWYDREKSLYTVQAGFSITDIGRIKFKNSKYSYDFSADKRDWYVKDFSAVEGYKSIGDTIRLLAADSLGFRINSNPTGTFGMWLPMRINIWADYNPVPFFGVHALASIAPALGKEGRVRHISTFTLTPHIDWRCLGLYLPLSYDVQGNFNAGATVRLGPVIIGTQDLLGLFAKSYVRNADIHVAVKIPILARNHRDRDKDKVSNRMDDCKKVKGTWETKGCPDRDGDSIVDNLDKCPDNWGPRETQGCPDKDGDGVYDMVDSCVDVKGHAQFNGCPDTDNDGVEDKSDDCPVDSGKIELKGCPDRDNDTVIDKEDDCPDVPGDKAHRGCPDSDGDGVYDNEDDCPTEPGLVDNKGCPNRDTDGDGVLDKDDDCPKVPGLKTNRGCPKLDKKEEAVIKYAFESLEFETGQDVIRKVSFPSLNALAKLLSEKSTYGLNIEGHTDDVGNDDFNLDLSRRRAESVRRYLIGRGVDGSKLATDGFGESRPIADNKTPAGRQKNRRVEMKIAFQ